MRFEVIHNAKHPVGTAKTFSEAQALMHDKAMEMEVELRRLHPDANIKAGWNRDSFYLDAMRGGKSLHREFWRIEERSHVRASGSDMETPQDERSASSQAA